jgi:hypothetical protein
LRVPWATPQRNALEGRNALDRNALEHVRNYKARWPPPCLKSTRWLRSSGIAHRFYSLGDFGFLSLRKIAMMCWGLTHPADAASFVGVPASCFLRAYLPTCLPSLRVPWWFLDGSLMVPRGFPKGSWRVP